MNRALRTYVTVKWNHVHFMEVLGGNKKRTEGSFEEIMTKILPNVMEVLMEKLKNLNIFQVG